MVRIFFPKIVPIGSREKKKRLRTIYESLAAGQTIQTTHSVSFGSMGTRLISKSNHTNVHFLLKLLIFEMYHDLNASLYN